MLHFNENGNWETQKSLYGKKYYKVTSSKFKNGEAVFFEICVPQTYGKFVKE